MATEYAELHCHSAFSLLDGASLPETLVERAIELGLSALALTDHDDLGGAVRFAYRARELGDFPAIIGLELTILDAKSPYHLTLLARTAEGYSNLSRLVSLAREHTRRGQPMVTMDTLAKHHSGLLCLSGCPQGAIPKAIARGDVLGARREAGRLQDIFGRYFAIEVMDHGLPEEAQWAEQLISLSKDLNAPWVVTNNVHYATIKERLIHDVLLSLKHGKTLDTAGRILRPNGEWYLKSPDCIAKRWQHHPEGIKQTLTLAEQCTFRLHDLQVPLPNLSVPKEFENTDNYLAHLTQLGATERWGTAITAVHQNQLNKELALIRRRSLAGYFLIMWEIIKFAESANILVQGRGSAANSAVCYCLGITAVDPIRYDLLFERFLSDARDGYPDIDLDIEHNRREEIIQFVYTHYGRTHAAMVCAHHCFRGRSAVHDTARVLGFGPEDGARLAKHAGRKKELTIEDIEEAGFEPAHPRIVALLKVVKALWGLPRHRGTHVGGFILSTRPIAEICPVEPAAMANRTIIQWDKDDLDLVKIPKFDLLGLGMLSAIAEGLNWVRSRHGIPAYLYGLPDRQEVYDMVARADTVGVFQIESRAQMNSLPRTRPSTLYELAIQIALIRPGPLQGDMVHPYIRRKRGEEPIDLIHPRLAPVLRRTLGIPLFQEQGMRLAVEAANFTADQAERLRRAISSQRKRHQLPALLTQLRVGLAENGIPPKTVERIVRQIASFSTYGFPESHSTSFALLVYASCWLKCFYPAEFLCALINAQPMGFYSVNSLVKDAQRHGVEVRPPCLKQSTWETRFEDHALRLGLRQVIGLGNGSRRQLQTARLTGKFTSAEDVIRRIQLPQKAWLTLAEAGTFSAFIPGDRRAAVWTVLHLAKTQVGPLPLGKVAEPDIQFRPQTMVEQTESDFRTTGLTTGIHPVLYTRSELNKRGVFTADSLKQTRNGQWVKVAGMVISRQRPETAKGFMFISLEDETGFINIIVNPGLFERYGGTLIRAPFLLVEGPVTCEQNVWNVKARRFEKLSLPGENSFPKGYNYH
jgi:error-prone DNA polymerase